MKVHLYSTLHPPNPPNIILHILCHTMINKQSGFVYLPFFCDSSILICIDRTLHGPQTAAQGFLFCIFMFDRPKCGTFFPFSLLACPSAALCNAIQSIFECSTNTRRLWKIPACNKCYLPTTNFVCMLQPIHVNVFIVICFCPLCNHYVTTQFVFSAFSCFDRDHVDFAISGAASWLTLHTFLLIWQTRLWIIYFAISLK